ncbi:MAG: hypothetical protein JXR76_18440 [Deltaproteobacteria bacterium]|nr:hypothetical protein [Deltaproteobacteria bacterium]
MRTALMSGDAGVYDMTRKSGNSGWKVPVIFTLSAASVVGLLLFSMYQRTEAKLLRMQYMVESMQADADEQVNATRAEVSAMTKKFHSVEKNLEKLTEELVQLKTAAKGAEQKKPSNGRMNAQPRKDSRTRQNSIEDLPISGELRLSSADDDPSNGFKPGELL